MTVRYFCDRCGNEAGPGELRQSEFSLPPDPDIALDLCPGCVADVRALLLGEAATAAGVDAASERGGS
jgi:hypothetical protein